MGTAARAYLCAGTLLVLAHVAVGGSAGLYEGIGFASAGIVALAAVVHRPPNRLGWYGVALAQTLFATGDLVYRVGPGGFPGPADALYLASYAVFIPSLGLLMGKGFAWRDWGANVDAFLISAALALASWMVFLDESFHPAFSPGSIVSLAYPIADMVCIAVMIRIALGAGTRNLAWWLVLAALVPLLVADGSYVVPALDTSYAIGNWVDAGWLMSYVLIATAALHPSMKTVAVRTTQRVPNPVTRILLSGVAVLTLPLAFVEEQLIRHNTDDTLLIGAALTLMPAMVARAVLLVRELERERRRASESERRFRMVFERAPIGISVGRDGVMSETNPAFQRMLGYTGEELAAMHYTQVTHRDDRELDVQFELDAGDRDAFSIDKRYIAKDGSPVDVRAHIALDLDDGLGISLLEDVTVRRELEEQLRQAQKLEAVGKLAGGIAHDFNNLMTAVLGYSDLLLKNLDHGDVSREKLEAIRESAVRASELTRQLLAFGRRQMLNTVDVDLRDVVARLEPLLRTLTGEDVRLVIEVGTDPAVVHADPTQLEQVVMNLALNARDAMPAGGTLSVTVEVEDGVALLAVADDGLGMDEQTRARIFEPFFTTKPVGAGTGLGLSTVHGIVGQTGGRIEVLTSPGRGAVFTVHLPLASLPVASAPATLVD